MLSTLDPPHGHDPWPRCCWWATRGLISGSLWVCLLFFPHSQTGPLLQFESPCSLQGGEGQPFCPRHWRKPDPSVLLFAFIHRLKIPRQHNDTGREDSRNQNGCVTHQRYSSRKSFSHLVSHLVNRAPLASQDLWGKHWALWSEWHHLPLLCLCCEVYSCFD